MTIKLSKAAEYWVEAWCDQCATVRNPELGECGTLNALIGVEHDGWTPLAALLEDDVKIPDFVMPVGVTTDGQCLRFTPVVNDPYMFDRIRHHDDTAALYVLDIDPQDLH